MTNLEKAARLALELCESIIDGKRIWSLSDMREVSALLRAVLVDQQTLREAALMVLDALIEMTKPQRTASESDRYKRVKVAMSTLESALAQQAGPVAIPGAIPMSEVSAKSRAMPDRAEALERARERLKQAEQPNALRIADVLDGMSIDEMTEALADDAAGELRWLYAEYQRLKQAEPVVMQYIALCDAMRYSERKDELTSPEEHAESLVAEIERLKQAEPVAEPKVTWGVDWGRNGDENCVAIIKKLPNGDIEVVAIECNPAKQRQSDPTEGNPSF